MDAEFVRWIQTSLNKVSKKNLAVDGKLGHLTVAEILAFQRSRGLNADGVVGPKTAQALVAAGAGPPPQHALHGGGSGHKHWIAVVTPLLNRYRKDVPLDFLLGWIDVESGGRISETTSLDERGYFQIHPDESRQLGLQHQRLSTDADYSIQSGMLLVSHYCRLVESRKFTRGGDLFWHLVKFFHAIGSKAASMILEDMEANNARPKSWSDVQAYAHANEARLFHLVKHSPTKWVHNVDELFSRGKADLAFVPT